MDCSLPGSSVHGILQARIQEWVSILFSRGSSRRRDWIQVSCIAGRFFTTELSGGLLFIESESCSVMSDSLWQQDYTVHGILQARILEWVAFPFSGGSSQPRDWIQVSCTAGGFFTTEPPGKPQLFSRERKIRNFGSPTIFLTRSLLKLLLNEWT